ncbi:MAG: class I SAM-dependent methyltransferase [Alphaproteobacteria bacterium]|nr:class I SAM-dependent methyltransferase [Alphaproteobacteria bacterium]MDE2495198.1 class I SAM-dependent methyltransferase [Alphaproteobacteria bacterium]
MLGPFLSRIIRHGTLKLVYSDGRLKSFGAGEPQLTVKFHDGRAMFALALNPDLKLGELYMNGRLTIEGGDVADLLALLTKNLSDAKTIGLLRLLRFFRRTTRRLAQFNPTGRAKAHVAHHYDLSSNLYDLFLDRDKQYSCAYFSKQGETLEEAQIGKKRHIAAKLNLDRPDLKVLDIGCGWGGLALDLARDCDANVLGVTLSENQIAVARERSQQAKLTNRCRFELTDYRALGGNYDRIISVGMFEHVGVAYYPAFFSKVRELLADDGIMLLHTIGRTDGPGATNPWITKYIFPGGYVPALSEVMQAVESSGLIVTDVEVLRLHYAETLKEWRRRFLANRAGAVRLYGERFCRMWEFYLAGSEMAFRHENEVVFQIQLAKRQDALPLTRDYMIDIERTMRFAGVERMPRERKTG